MTIRNKENKSISLFTHENVKSIDFVKFIIALISFSVSMHYFLSYKWLNSFFSIYNINLLPLISAEDLKYTFVSMNWDIILPSLLGFTWIALIRLIVPVDTYTDFGEKSKEEAKRIGENFKLMIKKYFELVYWKKLIGSFIFIMAVTLIFILFPSSNQSEYQLSTKAIIILLILFFCMPILYLFLSRKRNLVLGFYLFFIFNWANIAMDEIIVRAKEANKTSNVYTEVAFDYKGENIKSTSTFKYVYSGYKCVIMMDINDDTTMHIFPTSHIGRFTHKIVSKSN